jgi:hypothetical protein
MFVAPRGEGGERQLDLPPPNRDALDDGFRCEGRDRELYMPATLSSKTVSEISPDWPASQTGRAPQAGAVSAFGTAAHAA